MASPRRVVIENHRLSPLINLRKKPQAIPLPHMDHPQSHPDLKTFDDDDKVNLVRFGLASLSPVRKDDRGWLLGPVIVARDSQLKDYAHHARHQFLRSSRAGESILLLNSYSLKINKFSQLENHTAFSDHKYQSRLLSSGGYNWRLIVYPRGNVNDNVSGFISMDVELDSTSLTESSPTTEVFAELRFFVYNKKENKYFTIQDVEVKRFNVLNMVRGLQKVLTYETFINPENGYIFEGGQCEFGVYVIVPPPLTNWEIVSFDEKLLSSPKFSWTVKNFSGLNEYVYKSNSFTMGGRKWGLMLYPKGDSRATDNFLSFFLYLADIETLKPDEKIFCQVHLRVLNPLGSYHVEGKVDSWYEKSNRVLGWYNFVSLDEIRKTYLDKEDTLKVEAEFKVVSGIKYSTAI
ncbi:PREDICTED: uncharacterized protein LOC104753726 [Camelina sativa]|uniref:Uncharacterized protein LOC104753726 n=1 Tax=Camelina sativa TaxID=90675 RepID=A0ABM0WPK6_CAMSA|nr:PREDICTED: uncharacterized protein LOC104753726 [Camelina sativa]